VREPGWIKATKHDQLVSVFELADATEQPITISMDTGSPEKWTKQEAFASSRPGSLQPGRGYEPGWGEKWTNHPYIFGWLPLLFSCTFDVVLFLGIGLLLLRVFRLILASFWVCVDSPDIEVCFLAKGKTLGFTSSFISVTIHGYCYSLDRAKCVILRFKICPTLTDILVSQGQLFTY
jgi:hypothetical protein